MEGIPQRQEMREEAMEEDTQVEVVSGEAQTETLESLKAQLALLQDILKKDPEQITSEEREDLKGLLPLAGKIRALTKEVARKKGDSN